MKVDIFVENAAGNMTHITTVEEDEAIRRVKEYEEQTNYTWSAVEEDGIPMLIIHHDDVKPLPLTDEV